MVLSARPALTMLITSISVRVFFATFCSGFPESLRGPDPGARSRSRALRRPVPARMGNKSDSNKNTDTANFMRSALLESDRELVRQVNSHGLHSLRQHTPGKSCRQCGEVAQARLPARRILARIAMPRGSNVGVPPVLEHGQDGHVAKQFPSSSSGSRGQRFSDRGPFSCATPQWQSHILNQSCCYHCLAQGKIAETPPRPIRHRNG